MAGLFYIFKRARAAQASIRPPSVVDIREGGRSAETSLECLPGAGSLPLPAKPSLRPGTGQLQRRGCESAAGEADRIDEWDGRAL